MLTIGFLVVTVPIETAYSWHLGLTNLCYLVKVIGWALLGWGVNRHQGVGAREGVAVLTAGWGWLGANFWRAVADRLTRIAAGQTLRLGSVELWFAGSCLLVSLIGLMWSLGMDAKSRP
jgi:hypothetical protein